MKAGTRGGDSTEKEKTRRLQTTEKGFITLTEVLNNVQPQSQLAGN